VDVRFSDEELLLRDTVLALAEKAVPGTVPGLEGFDDAALWARLADAGVLGLGTGAGDGFGSLTDAAIAAAALGRALAPVPYLGCAVLPAHLLALAGAGGTVVDALVAGQRRMAVGIDPSTGMLASGHAGALAWDAGGARWRPRRRPEGAGLTTVELGPPTPGVDLTRVIRRTRAGAAAEGDFGALSELDEQRWYCAALALISADIVGVMEGALQLAVDHAVAREQFGVPIGSFQAIQHLLADQHTNLEGARSLAVYAAWAIEHRPLEEAALAAHAAKAYCSDAGKKVCEAVVQVHGGMGLTWECKAHVFLKRALADRAFLGDEHVHLRRVASLRRSEAGVGL
jgi:alkylation response protein AidB-like acyl-CoA dehydrogenase